MASFLRGDGLKYVDLGFFSTLVVEVASANPVSLGMDWPSGLIP